MPFSPPWCGTAKVFPTCSLRSAARLLVEEYGALEEFPIDARMAKLTATQIEKIALHLMQGNPRLGEDLAKMGSCDCSYALAGVARFRVNIFRQNGRPGDRDA